MTTRTKSTLAAAALGAAGAVTYLVNQTPPPVPQVLLTWQNNYDARELITVVESSTNLRDWTVRGYTTNGYMILPRDKEHEFFRIGNIETNS